MWNDGTVGVEKIEMLENVLCTEKAIRVLKFVIIAMSSLFIEVSWQGATNKRQKGELK
jgi:hypothetical protein